MKTDSRAQPTSAQRGSASRRSRRSPEELKERLLSAARDEFNRRGFAGATTAAIARRADVTEAQIFRYYASKTELFREAVFTELNRHFDEFQRQHSREIEADADIRGLSARYIADLQTYCRDRGKLLLSAIVAHVYKSVDIGDAAEIDGLSEYFSMGAAELARRSGEHARITPEIMVRITFAAVLANSLLRDWLFPDGLASDEDIDAAITDFVIEGIGGNQAEAADRWGRAAGERSTATQHQLAKRFIAALSSGELPDDLFADRMSAWTATSKHMDRRSYQLGVRLMRSIFAEPVSYDVRSLTAEADRVTVEADVRGKLLDGSTYENRYLFALTFDGERIASVHEYFDPEPVRAQVLPLLRSAIERLEIASAD